jgi:16S rRNA G966 N2-methylase RsmD
MDSLGSKAPKLSKTGNRKNVEPHRPVRQQVETGTAIQKAAERIGLSEATLKRCVKIIETAHEETKQKLRTGRTKISKVYKQLQFNERRSEIRAQKPIIELPNGFKLLQGDCRQRIDEIADNSVDLIFTDPPYNYESLPLYADLGKMAARVLKPGGSLIVYTPHHALLEIGSKIMQPGLRQVWTFCVRHTGHLARINSLHLLVNWKPLVWLVKGESQPNIIPESNFGDLITSAPPDKSLHEWTQSLTEPEYIIRNLTVENQVILDCFMGIGTTGIAALENKRQFIGIEVNQQTFEIAKANIRSSNTDTPNGMV